jgi:hypothetical protein
VPEFEKRNADLSPSAARGRLREPFIELRERIRVQIRAPQAAERVFPSDVRHRHTGRNLQRRRVFSDSFLLQPFLKREKELRLEID